MMFYVIMLAGRIRCDPFGQRPRDRERRVHTGCPDAPQQLQLNADRTRFHHRACSSYSLVSAIGVVVLLV